MESSDKERQIICPRCHRPAWKPDKVARIGKNPTKQYFYIRYRHRKDGRTKRNRACYVPATSELESR